MFVSCKGTCYNCVILDRRPYSKEAVCCFCPMTDSVLNSIDSVFELPKVAKGVYLDLFLLKVPQFCVMFGQWTSHWPSGSIE